jgi:conjugative transfer region protein TrbK
MPDGKTIATIAAIVLAALGVTLAAMRMTEDVPPAPRAAAPAFQAPVDPLRADLRRCQRLGEAAACDETCMKVWAENRDRFLGRVPAQAAPTSLRDEER